MTLLRRREAAARYRPKVIRLLLVAEAPPCDPDRYFYFQEVDRHDWLFRYVYEGLTGTKPDRADKAIHLAQLRDAGIFLIDLHEDHASQPTASQLEPCIPGLIERCRACRPRHIALIKSIVHDVALVPLRDAGFPVIDVRMPFPASGQQRKFLDGFRRALDIAGLRHSHAVEA